MVRTLILVSIASLVLCIGSFMGAFAIIGGPFSVHDWKIDRDRWTWGFTDDDEHWGHTRRHGLEGEVEDGALDGAHISRDVAWSGGDHLDIEAPADVVYTQGPVARLTIAGPAEAVNRVVVSDGRIRYRSDRFEDTRLKIMMTAPDVRRFDLSGSQNLVIEGYSQDRLDVDISGNAHVSAKGTAKTVSLDIAGSGDADLEEMAVQDANIDISGSGHAKLGPKGAVKVDVSGSGEVELTAKPASLASDISGSGKVRQPGD